jgi:hypothetical protein
MARILVSGAVANKPRSGGEAWVRLSWLRGLRRLGHEVCFVEQIESADPVGLETFRVAVAALVPDCPVALLCDGDSVAGLTLREVAEWSRRADLLVNVSGHLEIEAIKEGPRRRAYIDVDPVFTQIWAEEGAAARLEGHDTYFTVGENLGTPGCSIPTARRRWLPLPPPVTLDDWPVLPVPAGARFTSVATWRSPLGTLAHGEKVFEGKHHQWRRLIHLPRRVDQEFEIALRIDPADEPDQIALEANDWHLSDPTEVADDPLAFRSYVQASAAEFSVAHPAYVDTGSGWVSDRTVRYLASGRPALVQDTGLGNRYPVGEGLLTFRTPDEAVAGVEAIAADYEVHSRAARALAEAHFDSDRVLGRFLEAAL